MPTNEEQLKKYYAAAHGNDLRADDSAFGVTPNGGSNYGGNKMRRDPFAQANGPADMPTRPENRPQDYPDYTGQRPIGQNRPNSGTEHETFMGRPGPWGDQGGNQVGVRPGRPENPWQIPGTGGVQKSGNVAGTESTTPGAAAGTGETGGAAGEKADWTDAAFVPI